MRGGLTRCHGRGGGQGEGPLGIFVTTISSHPDANLQAARGGKEAAAAPDTTVKEHYTTSVEKGATCPCRFVTLG